MLFIFPWLLRCRFYSFIFYFQKYAGFFKWKCIFFPKTSQIFEIWKKKRTSYKNCNLYKYYLQFTWILCHCFRVYLQFPTIWCFLLKTAFYTKEYSNNENMIKNVKYLKIVIKINVIDSALKLYGVVLIFYLLFPEISDFSSFFTFCPQNSQNWQKINKNCILNQNQAYSFI